MPLGTWTSRKTSVLWWSANCKNVRQTVCPQQTPPISLLHVYFRERKNKTLLMPNSSFCRRLPPRLSLTEQIICTVYFAEVPLCFQRADFSAGKDVLLMKISRIGSPGTGGILGQAEIHRLVPDLWKRTSKTSPSSVCFNSPYKRCLPFWKMISKLQIRLLKISVFNQQSSFSPGTICHHLIMFRRKERDTLD